MSRAGLREAVYGAANLLPARIPRQAPLILAFRRIPEARQFETYMDELSRLGRRPVPLQAVAAWAGGDGSLEPGAIALTFDDGYRNQLEHAAPALRRAGAPATFFAVAGALGTTAVWREPATAADESAALMTGEELASLAADGFEVGSQSVSHRYLAYLRPEDQRDEAVRSRALLEEVSSTPVRAFRYPFDSFDREVVEQLSEAGFTAAVAGGPREVRAGDEPLLLPRVEIPEDVLGHNRFAGHVRGAASRVKALGRVLFF